MDASKAGHWRCRIPESESRAFVLVPLGDIAPSWKHPVSGQNVSALIEALPEAERQIVRAI